MTKKLNPILELVIAAIAITLVVFIWILPRLVRSNGIDQSAWCSQNIRQIDAAIAQWAFDKHLTKGTSVTTNDIQAFFPEGFPQCPIGGHYIFSKVGELTACSMPTNTHKLVY
jgi:hypothetical protein